MQPTTITLAAAISALAACTATSEDNKLTVRRLYEESINRRDWKLLNELVAEDYRNPNGETGPAGYRATVEPLTRGIPDIRFTVEDLVGEADRVAVRWSWSGVQTGPLFGFPSSNRPITNTGMVIYQLRDGKIVRSWLEVDRLGVLQQIGVIPRDLARPPARRP